MRDFRKLGVWNKAHALTLAIYEATATFPREEVYGLTGQLRRAATSIASNIAEGCGRDGDSEFRRFLYMAMGSANEVEYQLILARDLSYVPNEVFDSLQANLNEVKRMLSGLLRTIGAK